MKFFHDIAKIWAAFVERMLYILDPNKVNDEVEYLRMQIQVERNEKMDILERFSTKPIETEEIGEQVTHEPINPYIPWRVRRAQLEFEHRVKVQTPNEMSKTQQDIANLEEELEISNAD